ncbi:MAG TPA: Flp pilus assembly protein CpaB [Caulobacteraceae bacterium]|jgi:pilus assembly protein CpaB|nr:Flp pilus assembly protein CpaB [Caulobacteraceae bacterium]
MRLGTIVSIGASAVLGIGALLIARLWIPNHGPHPAALQQAPVVAETAVVVAAKPIPWGAKLDGQYLKVIELPVADIPQGAYSNTAQILNQDGGPPIALSAMAQQEPVLASKLSGPGERQTLAALVDPNMRAYTIGVTAVTAGGGHILPGDRVDVVLTRELPLPTNLPVTGAKLLQTVVVLQSVRVLGMDLNANPTSTQPAIASTATLEVNMQDAEKLALASQVGTITLALRRPGSVESTQTRSIMVNDVSGADRRYLGLLLASHRMDELKSGPPRSTTASVSHGGGGASITVVSGDTATDVRVPFESSRSGL